MSNQPTSESDETTLGQALTAEADRVAPTADWADVQRRAGRPRGRGVVYAVAAAALVGLVAVVVPVLLTDRGAEVAVTPGLSEEAVLPLPTAPASPEPTPSATAETTADPTPSPVWPALDVPAGEPLGSDEIVAIVQRETPDEFVHDLVVLDASGQVVRTLEASVSGVEGGVYQLSVSPNGRTVLYGRGTSACEGVIEALAADGSSTEPVRLLAGNAAVLSFDGGLAAIDPRDGCSDPPNRIDIVPTAGGQGQRFGEGGMPLAGLGNHDDVGLNAMAFLGPNTLLYSVRTTADGFDPDGGLWALDLDSGTDRRIDPLGQGGRYRWLHALDEGRLAALHEGTDGWQVLVMDAETVFSVEPTPGWEAAHNASVNDVLGTVIARGFGIPTLMIEGEVVRADVLGALTVAGVAAPDPQPTTPPLTDAQRDLARERLDQLLTAFVGEDFAEAARHWSGYPDVAGDDPEAVVRELAAGREISDWPMLDPDAGPQEVFVTPAWSFGTPSAAVVTFLYPEAAGGPAALAFLVDVTDDPGELGAVIRLPSWRLADDETPVPGGEVAPGARVVIPGVPIEGGAFAHVNGQPVPVEVDHERFETVVSIPDDATGTIVLTLSLATPEAPAAAAFPLRVVPDP